MSAAKILLVDDVRVFLEFERPFFERAGCEVLTASSGSDALRMVRAENPHIVLLDYEMPDMNGDEVCRKIKEDPARRHIPVLMITSHGGADVAERCRRAGCTDVIVKPISGRDLLDRVVRILQIPYRVHLRTRVVMEVAIGVSGDAIAVLGYSENVSEGGMLVETPEPLEAGAAARLDFALPPSARRIRTPARVIRIAGPNSRGLFSAALSFEAPEPVVREALRAFVSQEADL